MLKKYLIFSLLIFSYAIVLGHNVIPHKHFDDLLSPEHYQDSHKDSDHKHNYSFSHSITLHVAIDKQSLAKAYSTKNIFKKIFSNNIYCIPVTFKPLILSFFSEINFNRCIRLPIKEYRDSFSNRAPPVSMS